MKKNRKSATKVLLATIVLTVGMSVTAFAEEQTQGMAETEIHHNEGYDAEHPLAGKIDEWGLRLPYPYIGATTITNNNIQAMLTGQMDQYYMPPVGYSTDELGNSIYTSETAYANNIKFEQDLYNWYCNWLNSFDFQNMSEMERAKEIQTVLASAKYVDGAAGGYSYGVLIDKQGQCSDFVMTACSLAKALGLKSGMGGNGNHSWYYIQVDGEIYSGENEYLNLNYPTSDYVYVD